MTLSVENLHSAVNRKQGTQPPVSYAQGLAITIKEYAKVVIIEVSITSLAESNGIHYQIQQFPWHHYNSQREKRTCPVRR